MVFDATLTSSNAKFRWQRCSIVDDRAVAHVVVRGVITVLGIVMADDCSQESTQLSCCHLPGTGNHGRYAQLIDELR